MTILIFLLFFQPSTVIHFTDLDTLYTDTVQFIELRVVGNEPSAGGETLNNEVFYVLGDAGFVIFLLGVFAFIRLMKYGKKLNKRLEKKSEQTND